MRRTAGGLVLTFVVASACIPAAPPPSTSESPRPANSAAPGTNSANLNAADPAPGAPSTTAAPPIDPFDETLPESIEGEKSPIPVTPTSDLGPGLHALVFSSPRASLPVNYLLFLPENYRSVERWPTIVYLHGKSLSGDDPQMLTKYGIPKIVSRDRAFPFVVVAPQCRAGERWTDLDTLNALIDDIVAHYPIDPSRLYLTGFSMGAGGAWRLAGARPERFAAVAALAGVEEIGSAKGLARVPVWAFHGTDDDAVPASASQAMVGAIRAAGGNARLEILPGRGHDIADVYDRKELYAWFLQNRRR
jgi:pimeloyl-ACP methyl ester carboxylesterase